MTPNEQAELRNGVTYQLPSVGDRFVARLLDALIIGIPALVLLLVGMALLIGGGGGNSVIAVLAGIAIEIGVLIFLLLYEWLSLAKTGQTIGKRIRGIQVVSVDTGLPPGTGKAFGRTYLPAVLGIIPLLNWVGFLALLWHPNRQTWYDQAAGTIVIKIQETLRT